MNMPVPNFKDFLATDIQNVFLNVNEFAETYTIDGKSVKAMLDSATDSKHPLAYAEGVSLVADVLYVDAQELGRVPKQNGWITVNGVEYHIIRVASERGMLALYLEVNAG
jgi:hypothetical protein